MKPDFDHKKSKMETLIASPVIKSFLSGSLSGFTSTVVFQPFDLVKTRIQTAAMANPAMANPAAAAGISNPAAATAAKAALGNSHAIHTTATETTFTLASASSSPGRMSIVGVVLDVVRTEPERVRGLWRGVTPSVARTVPGVGLYFSVLHAIKTRWDVTQPSASQSLVIGAASRTIAGSILLPFTVIKARYESGFFGYTGIGNAFVAIYRIEGVRGLWSGMCATVMRDAPFSGLYLMFYNEAKKSAMERRASVAPWLPVPTLHFLCGLWAGALASVVTQPPDVLKTHMQLNPQMHRKVTTTLLFVYRKNGVKGFFRGLVPRTMRRTLMAATAWTVYEQLMNWLAMK